MRCSPPRCGSGRRCDERHPQQGPRRGPRRRAALPDAAPHAAHDRHRPEGRPSGRASGRDDVRRSRRCSSSASSSPTWTIPTDSLINLGPLGVFQTLEPRARRSPSASRRCSSASARSTGPRSSWPTRRSSTSATPSARRRRTRTPPSPRSSRASPSPASSSARWCAARSSARCCSSRSRSSCSCADMGPLPGDSLRAHDLAQGQPHRRRRLAASRCVPRTSTSARWSRPRRADLDEVQEEEGNQNARAKASIILVRMKPQEIRSQQGENWDYQGILAFSKICTHVGCPIALYQQRTHHLLCPCHQSTFDLADSGNVVFGPAAGACRSCPSPSTPRATWSRRATSRNLSDRASGSADEHHRQGGRQGDLPRRRAGTDLRLLKANMRKVFPDHWSFMLGEIALYSFIILLLTGVYLTIWFKPSMVEVVYDGTYQPLVGIHMSEAYASALDISFDVRGGLLLRQIHHWAALFFLAVDDRAHVPDLLHRSVPQAARAQLGHRRIDDPHRASSRASPATRSPTTCSPASASGSSRASSSRSRSSAPT